VRVVFLVLFAIVSWLLVAAVGGIVVSELIVYARVHGW
jgi:hypothetical protein